MKGKTRSRIFCLAACAVILTLTALLCVFVRPAYDDFYYATFTDGGVRGFLTSSIDHFKNVTGRAFVHAVLCPLLTLDMWPFRVFLFALVCALAYVCAKICVRDKKDILAAFVAYLCVFWLAGITTLSDSVLWGAGALNYLFPVTLVVLYYFLLDKYAKKNSGGFWIVGLAFLTSATVEMTGLLAIVAVMYVIAVNFSAARKRIAFCVVNFAFSVLGYATLYATGGVAKRLGANDYASVGLISRINVNFALFDRKICAENGIFAIVILALAAASVLAYSRKRVSLGIFCSAAAFAVAMTGFGIVYDGIAIAAVSIFAFSVLVAFSIWTFVIGDRVIPFFMLCTSISLAVCMVSPVVGARMVLPSAVFLAIICVRAAALCGFSRNIYSYAASALAIPAAVLLGVYIGKYAANAKVIDENSRTADLFAGGDSIVLSYVPDEKYGPGTVPTAMNFGEYYLSHKGIRGVSIEVSDPSRAKITYDGNVLSREAVVRDGRYFVPVRVAGDALGASVDWELASAVVTYEGKSYCFHTANKAANFGHGVSGSVKLCDEVRSIGGSLYISVRDFERIFGAELEIG